ncbi:tetratricopeptide repeat protein [bacterium]|nr:tetratricopeptide repeat protein [bacterium]
MKSKFFIISFLLLMILTLWGCAAKMGQVLGTGYLYQNAERKLEDANMKKVEGQKEDAKNLTDQALELFLQITETEDAGSKYFSKAHYQIAGIYMNRFDWDNATKHYQTIMDAQAGGYLAGKSRTAIANVRKNRQLIDENRTIYLNVPEAERKDPKSEGYSKAARALQMMSDSYENLGAHEEAIKNYTELVDNFPDYNLAPQAQFTIGNIYFYKLYDYATGWQAFLKVIERFPESFEAKKADTLLKETDQTLKEIKHDQDYVLKYRREKAVEFKKAGRYVDQSEVYSVFGEQVAQAYINIARGWLSLKNYPFAVKAYKELVEELPMEKFVVADSLFQVGKLYQDAGDYEKSIEAYDNLFDKAPESGRRDEAIYRQAVCYESIREFTKAHEQYETYMSLGTDREFYRQAQQKVRQMEYDGDKDGHPFYKEQEAGTSDEDADAYPGSSKTAMR